MPSLEEELRQLLPTGWEYLTCQSEQVFSLQFSREGLNAIARITENYPGDPAYIDLAGSEWEAMREEMQKKIIQDINEFAKGHTGQAMLNKILEKAWNITRVDASGTPIVRDECVKPSQPSKKSKKKTKHRIMFQMTLAPNFSMAVSTRNADKKKGRKSSSMKTAKDVINRLRQDQLLENENFLMGYEDRSNRTFEVPVSSVKWEDDAITDSRNNRLILEYHIQQFKWNSKTVWDKSTNTDHVFGSGSIGIEDDLVKFIKRHKAQGQFESYKSQCSSLKMEASNSIQQSSVIEESQTINPSGWNQFHESTSSKPKSGNCLVNSLRHGGNVISTVAESSLKKKDDNENLVESNENGGNLEMDIKSTILDNNSQLDSSSDDAVTKLTPGDSVSVNSAESTSNTLSDEINCEKSNMSSKNDSYPIEQLQEAHEHSNYQTGYHHGGGEDDDDDDRSPPSHGDDSLRSSESLKLVVEKDLSKSGVENSDRNSIDDNTNYKETEEDCIEENPLLAMFLSDEEREEVSVSDKISCPKDGNTKDRKYRQKYQPYQNSHKEKRTDKRFKRRDREAYEKQPRFYHDSGKGSSEEMPHRYRYCIAVDAGSEASKLRRLQRQIRHSPKTKAKLRNEEYFYINVANVTFDNVEEKRGVQELLKRVCNDVEAFEVWVHEVKPQGKTIVATLADEAFRHFSKKLLEQTPSNVNITCNPHIQLVQIHGDSRGIENQKFPHESLKFFIKSMYLWNLDDGDGQPVHYISLQHKAAHSHEEQHQRWRGPSSRFEDHKNSKREFLVSKKLSSVLRHNDLNFTIDDEGYLDVNSILQHQFFKKFHVTESDIERIVQTNAKKRFALIGTPGNYQIRATQGHTVKYVELNLRKLEDPDEFPNVIHGTMHAYYQSIVRQGLSRMKRNHIHMTTGLPRDENQVVSGMRNSSDCFIYVDVRKAMNDGIEFFVSDNGVILSEGVDGTLEFKYFKKVVCRIGGQDRELPSWDRDKSMSTERDSKL